jgi:Uma2 family endonuclease
MSVAEALLTLEEYAQMPEDGRRTELVRGRIVELPPPKPLHGRICYRVASIVGRHVDANDLGTILINDAGIITRRDPDSVRGADVAYYSYARMPRGPLPETYPDVPPDLVIEVRSPSDRWRDIHVKVAEYLTIGVLVVCVLDPETKSAHLFYPEQPNRTLGPDDELIFPECLPDFRVRVASLFE